jgi:hypothetical protein
MRPAEELQILRPPWRIAAAWLLSAALVVALGFLILGGGRPAVAAGECQYGQYGPYAQYEPYGPYAQPCPKARPTVRLITPPTVQIGTLAFPTAVLENGNNPTGTLIVRLHRPGQECANPNQPPPWLGEVTVNGNGFYQAGSPFGVSPFLDQLGTWVWSATYVGDSLNELTSTVCGAFTTNVVKRTPGLGLSEGGPFPHEVGTSLVIQGTFSAYAPSEALTLRVYGPGDPDCVGTPAFVRDVRTTQFEATFGPLESAGTWKLTAAYPGDANNAPLNRGCATPFAFQVSKVAASLTPVVTPDTVAVGQPVSAGATVFGHTPTGTLTVKLFGPSDPSCASPVATQTVSVTGSGPVRASLVPTSAGQWRVTTEYSGDAANLPAATGCGSIAFTATKAVPALELVSIPTAADARDTLRASVLVSDGYQPAGRILFRLFGPADAACAGAPTHAEEVPLTGSTASTSGSFTVPKKQEGAWNWTATYLGDDNNESVSTACGQAPVAVARNEPPPEPSTGPLFEANVHFNCLDHTIGVPYGSRLVLRYGFATSTERQIKQFLKGIEMRVVVDGVRVRGVKQLWETPVPAGSGWVAWWTYDTGRGVTQGASPFAIEFEVVATKAGSDGSSTWQAGAVLGTSSGPCLVDGFQP